jgi:hypothetical protein
MNSAGLCVHIPHIPLCRRFLGSTPKVLFTNGQCSGIQCTWHELPGTNPAVAAFEVRADRRSRGLVRTAFGGGGMSADDRSLARSDSSHDAPLTTREQRRSRRKREIRACTISIKRMTQRDVDNMRRTALEERASRPTHRIDCADGPRPCPFVSCKYHLYLDVSPRTGSIKVNFPDLEVWDMPHSCALDVADIGGATLEDVGSILNLTRERIRQLEVKALGRLEVVSDMKELRELCGFSRRPRVGSARDFDSEPSESPSDEEFDDLFD